MKISAVDAIKMQGITNLEVKGLFVDGSPWFIHILRKKGSCISSFRGIHFIITERDKWWGHIMGHPVYADADYSWSRNGKKFIAWPIHTLYVM